MAIDVSYCNRQADKLSDAASNLRTAKAKLKSNKKLLSQVWTDKSVNKVLKKIDDVIKEIDDVLDDCSVIRANIRNAAYEIRQEEIAEQQRQQLANNS